jgi:hypothetical protein
MVDIPALVKNRMRKALIEFWKAGEIDKLRRATWIYEPGWEPVDKRLDTMTVATDSGQLEFEMGGGIDVSYGDPTGQPSLDY